MTVTNNDFENTLTANGVATTFPFTFRCINKTDIIVVNLTDAVTLEYGVDYTVTINSNGVGGTVTTIGALSPHTNGDQIHIYRLMQRTQEIDFIAQQDLRAEVIENALDKDVILIQQLENTLNYVKDTVIPALTVGPGDGNTVAGGIAYFTGTDGVSVDDIDPGSAGDVLTSNGAGTPPSFQPPIVTTISLGTMVVPGTTTARSIVLWNAADGTAIKNGPALGTAGQILTSNGAGADPSFQDLGDVFEASGDPGTAGQVWTSQGAGLPAHFADPAGGSTLVLNAPGADYYFPALPNEVHLNLYDSNNLVMDTSIGGGSAINDAEGFFLEYGGTGGGFIRFYDDSGQNIGLTQCRHRGVFTTRFKTPDDLSAGAFHIGLVENSADVSGVSDGDYAGFEVALLTFVPEGGVDGTAFWRTRTCDGTTTTETQITTASIAVDTVYDFAVDLRTPGEIRFYLDGTLINTHSANIPASATPLGVHASFDGGAGTSGMIIGPIRVLSN